MWYLESILPSSYNSKELLHSPSDAKSHVFLEIKGEDNKIFSNFGPQNDTGKKPTNIKTYLGLRSLLIKKLEYPLWN